MKLLPEHPSLDHLRQQAKDLLALRRSSDPTATLSQTQAEVARRHGFHTWSELKADVERRRAHPKVADHAVARALAERFGLGAVSAEMVAVERAWAGEVWLLETARGRSHATQLFEWTTDAVASNIEQEVRLVDAARDVGVCSPIPVRATDGGLVAEVAGATWRMHEHVKLGPPPGEVTPEHAALAGGALAALHLLAMPTDRPVSLPPPAPLAARWLNWQPEEAHWRAVLASAEEADAPWAEALRAAIPAYLAAAGVCRDISVEKSILSKCGLGPGDLRRDPEGRPVFLGWEHVGPLPPSYDFGGCVAGLEPALARAFATAYREAGASTPPLDLGMFTTAISANLNWTISRINIALHETDAARREIAGREVPMLVAEPPSLERYRRVLDALEG